MIAWFLRNWHTNLCPCAFSDVKDIRWPFLSSNQLASGSRTPALTKWADQPELGLYPWPQEIQLATTTRPTAAWATCRWLDKFTIIGCNDRLFRHLPIHRIYCEMHTNLEHISNKNAAIPHRGLRSTHGYLTFQHIAAGAELGKFICTWYRDGST